MIEYELIQQHQRELRHRAEQERLVLQARAPRAGRGLRRLVTTRTERRAAHLREC
ncbi:hypothetical protein ACFVVX_14960 [Kitasatospora sp. NPDC058170]|uniref:hypothetical protein n=1 Tax=Kitasatospora sp. NPDC058170 TaxID=3346364 RepID=UPI0036DF650B